MKRFAYYIALLPLVALCGCSHDDIDEITAIGNGKIVIESKLDNMHITRADIADTSKERTVEYIDVFAVDANGNIAYYERNTSSGNNGGAAEDGAGTLTLNVARRAKDADGNFYFAADAKYSFYLVANAKATEAEMGAIATLSDLQLLVQDDSFDPNFTTSSETTTERLTLLHLSGTSQGKNNDGYETPQTFLMDAVAASGTETSVVVNPATGSVSNLDLTAEFKRAAAKIIVNITQGADVEFHKQIDTEGSVYEFYKLPANTFVLPHEESLVGIKLINTAPMVPNDETFIWQADAAATNQLQIIGYAYAHSWDNTTWANETSLILNIPMMWNKDNSDDHSKEAEASKSWYKVPLSQQKMFERNKCYVVNINVNAVGAANRSTAIELRDIEYKTLDWQSVGVDVGDNDERPEFLVLNTDLVEMYNVNFDNTSLSFSSSSPIASIELADVYSHNIGTEEFSAGTDSYSAYYLNKYNAKTALNSTIRGTISASPEADVLNGAISITSPIKNDNGEETHYNTIRYLEFVVTNEQGLTATFRVMQYPTIYITNTVGWYSYRDDFIASGNSTPTTYENIKQGGIVGISYDSHTTNNDGVVIVTYDYNTSVSGFWRSKVNRDVESKGDYNNTQSSYDLDYYYWSDGHLFQSSGLAYSGAEFEGNARMYNIKVTATSAEYTIGRPRIIDYSGNVADAEHGFTDPSEENTRLVSPSFMTASRLGFINTGSGNITFGDNAVSLAVARDHCKNYVEVSADGEVFNDWRLPTAAEIGIILGLQGTNASDATKAIDYLLNAKYYYSASGPIENSQSNSSGTSFRCVRDAY